MAKISTVLFHESFRTERNHIISKETFNEHFKGELHKAKTFAEIEKRSIKVLDYLRRIGAKRIGLVSGIITSDGPANIDINTSRLYNYTKLLRETLTFPIFCGLDIFSEELRLQLAQQPASAWNHFWINMIKSGRITDLFMTPRWEKSTGSVAEYNTAIEMNLTISYVNPNGNNRSRLIFANFFISQNGHGFR